MKILLTFDLEEFDFIREEKKFEISKQGLLVLLKLLDKHNIKATFFTTALFAKKYPKLIKDMQKEGHEIACHGYSHSDSYFSDLSNIPLAKKEIEKIIGKEVKGFRAPRFEIKRIEKLYNFGFKYDSSLHPTLMPGRYNNFLCNIKMHKIKNIVEIPLSVLPVARLPIMWIFFRILGKTYAKIFAKLNNLFSDYTMLIFHPWEFSNLNEEKVSFLFRKNSGKKLLSMLESYILFCEKQNYEFSTISNYLKLFPKIS
jgi:peptidoglycan/xylan/chitin deacetylase (PgdA/CDA1 family)